MRPSHSIVTIVVVVAVLAAGCGPGTESEPDRAEPVSEPSRDAGLVEFTKDACDFDALASTEVTCGWLTVPSDRSEPDAGTVRLRVAVYEATADEPAADPVVMVGGAAATWSGIYVEPFEAFAVDRDVVVFDERGWGASQPSLACPEVAERQIELRGEHASGEEWSGQMFDAYMACRDRLLSEEVDLSVYSTTETAADIVDLADALGYDEYNLMAHTPGSRAVLTVLRDHPEAVRSVVLNAAYPMRADMAEDAHASAEVLEALFAACEDNASCREAYPGLDRVFWGLVERLDISPVTVSVEPASGDPSYDAVVDGDTLIWAVLVTLGMSLPVAALPWLVSLVDGGDEWALHEFLSYVNVPSGDGHGASVSAECREVVPFVDRAAYHQRLAEAGRVGAMFPGREDIRFDLCGAWPVAPAPGAENEPIVSDVPTLILAGEYDPYVRPSSAEEVAATLAESHVVELPGVANGLLGQEPCATDVALAFIDDPTGEPEAACVASMRTAEFLLPDYIDSVPPEPLQIEYDGLWTGTTSQGEDIGFRVEAGEVTMALLRRIPEVCPGSYVDSMQAYDPPLGHVHSDEVHITLGEGGDQIDGTFESKTTASGTATMQCATPVEVTWEAERTGDADTDLPQDDWYGATPPAEALPTYDIPDHLCDTEAGAANFDDMTVYFDNNDDWYLVGTWLRSFIPVPAGWTITETGSGVTMFHYSDQRNLADIAWESLNEGEVVTFLSVETTSPSVTDAIETLTGSLGSDPAARIVESEVVDDTHGYVVVDSTTPDQAHSRILVTFADNIEAGWIDSFTAVTSTQSFAEFYPIITSMLNGWYSIHGAKLGPPLPESLP